MAGAVKDDKEKEKPLCLRTFKVLLNGTHKRTITIDTNNPSKSRFMCSFGGAEFLAGKNRLTFDGAFDRRTNKLLCSTSLLYVTPKQTVSPEANGIEVNMKYNVPELNLAKGENVKEAPPGLVVELDR